MRYHSKNSLVTQLVEYHTDNVEVKGSTPFETTKGEMAEWSNALVLKTSECSSGGSNPSLSAKSSALDISLGTCIIKKS